MEVQNKMLLRPVGTWQKELYKTYNVSTPDLTMEVRMVDTSPTYL
jgi:hypothetical protein